MFSVCEWPSRHSPQRSYILGNLICFGKVKYEYIDVNFDTGGLF